MTILMGWSLEQWAFAKSRYVLAGNDCPPATLGGAEEILDWWKRRFLHDPGEIRLERVQYQQDTIWAAQMIRNVASQIPLIAQI
jgi:hypothetical protein